MSRPAGKARGTSNSNDRGSAEQRRRRRAWLLVTYAADTPILRVTFEDGRVLYLEPGVQHRDVDAACSGIMLADSSVVEATHVPTARCYRCGILLRDETITVDRIVPGCKGGTYRRENIRPCCADCNETTGGALGAARTKRGGKRAP